MSGVRRKTKYRKGVEADVLDSFPEPKEGEQIVRVISSRGGNLLEVESVEGLRALCRLPNRYRQVVWVKRGMLLIVATCTEDFKTANGEEGKVKFVVNNVVFTDAQTKHLRNAGLLPQAFDKKDSEKDEDEDDDPLLHVNRNRRGPNVAFEESSSDDDGEAEEEEVNEDEEEDEDDHQDSDEE